MRDGSEVGEVQYWRRLVRMVEVDMVAAMEVDMAVAMAVDMAAVTEAAVAAAPEPISSTEHLYILLLI